MVVLTFLYSITMGEPWLEGLTISKLRVALVRLAAPTKPGVTSIFAETFAI